MLKQLIVLLLVVGSIAPLHSQSLYTPREIQKAYNQATRSPDGKPGKNYWQNYGRYNIQVTALPPDRTIKGTEQITYVNNSPDTLKSLNMKLIINIHRPGAARVRPADDDYLTPGMQIDAFTVNTQPIKWNNHKANSTNQEVKLPTPLLPHDSVKLDIAFHYEISLKSGREGMIDPNTFYLAYFYPRVSVYDDYNGWDKLEFTDYQEFYNDFNDYTLKITVPKDYVVWATGTLQNPKEVLQPEFAKRLQASFTSDSTIHVATLADMTSKKVTQQNATNTWVWTAGNISDMAVGISDHYVWDAASVLVDDATHRRASMQAAFADTSKDFHRSVQNGRNALNLLSHQWPGVPYPFPKMTAFQGEADMEYPMMVNDNSDKDLRFAQFVQDHEIAHTYFPFYMGINESRYAFMDEGWATTMELLMATTEIGKAAAEAAYKKFRVKDWTANATTSQELPIITPSNEQKAGYGNNAYVKPSLSYLALKEMLGDDLFKKCLHTYMDRWNGKHPMPWDYFNTMNDASGKKLNWFFNNWFFTHNYIDLKIAGVSNNAGVYQISIDNVGGFAIPYDIIVSYTDGSWDSFHQSPAVWEVNQKNMVLNVKGVKTIKSVKLESGIFMDANEKDNVWVAK